MPSASLVIAAGGRGERFGAAEEGGADGLGRTKVFAAMAGRPVLARTLEVLAAVGAVTEAVVAVPEAALKEAQRTFGNRFGGGRRLVMVAGGERRPDSVAAALDATDPGTELVIVHDAVRPLIRRSVVEEAMRMAVEHGAAVVGRPIDHTIKRVGDDRRIAGTLSRQELWLAQTPQVFRREVIVQAYAGRQEVVGTVTDDAQLVEAMGHEVVMVPGDAANFKITTREDLRLCEALWTGGWPFGEA